MGSVILCPKCGSSPLMHRQFHFDDEFGQTGRFCYHCYHQWAPDAPSKEAPMATIDTLRNVVMHVDARLDVLAAEEAVVLKAFAERRQKLESSKAIASAELRRQCTHQQVIEQSSGVLRYCPTCGLKGNQHEENPLRRAALVTLVSDDKFYAQSRRLAEKGEGS